MVEMEIGHQAMPKPLLSGYFTNQLNSVQQAQELQKSLEDGQKNLRRSQGTDYSTQLEQIREAEEMPHSELL